MSPNEQCHFELALIKVRRIQNRWSGCVPGVAARQRILAPRQGGQGAGTGTATPGDPLGRGHRDSTGGEGSCCEHRAPNP